MEYIIRILYTIYLVVFPNSSIDILPKCLLILLTILTDFLLKINFITIYDFTG